MTDVEEIKNKIDIESLVREYVTLKPAGNSLKGLCPFHDEKTPSFIVNRERERWHCFGCNKGGDIFSFIQEIEGLNFVEALKMLADKAGVKLSKQISEVNTSAKNRQKDIMSMATHFFHEFLHRMDNAGEAREYLQMRGITNNTINHWQIGFAPAQWDLLTKYLLKKGFAIEDMVGAGLIIKKDVSVSVSQNRYYDRFRDRIMFPIHDLHGSVVGFTGRLLRETEAPVGKYINTPQTEIYDKSQIIFGLDKAKSSIRELDMIVMVEGQMDVIACHQAGMTNVVATSGTALTEQQIKLMMRYSKNVSMAFDADEAGQMAAKRGIDLALTAGMNIRVITLPIGAGKDPDECIKTDKSVWFQAVLDASDIMEWYFKRAFSDNFSSSPKDKQRVVDILLPEILRNPYAVERDHWLRELGGKINVDVSVLREDIDRISTNTKINPYKNEEQTQVKNNLSAPLPQSKLEILIERYLSLTLRYPEITKVIDHKLLKDVFDDGDDNVRRALYGLICMGYTDFGDFTDSNITSDITTHREILLFRSELEFYDMDDKSIKEEIEKLSFGILGEWKTEKRRGLELQIREAEKNNDKDKLDALIDTFQQLFN